MPVAYEFAPDVVISTSIACLQTYAATHIQLVSLNSFCWIRCCGRGRTGTVQGHTCCLCTYDSYVDGPGWRESRGSPRGKSQRWTWSSILPSQQVFIIQGGYNLQAISNSAEAVARALVGESLDVLRPMRVSDIGNEVVYQVVKMQSQFWRCLRGKASAPIDSE
jgi:hypothetical protein